MRQQHNDTFWILLEGQVQLTVGGRPRKLLGPGDYFGTISMLDGRPAPGAAVTLTPIRALVASASQFRALEGNDTVALRLMSNAVQLLRRDLVEA